MQALETFFSGEREADYAGAAGLATAVDTSEAIKRNLEAENDVLSGFYIRTFYGTSDKNPGIVTFVSCLPIAPAHTS